MLNARQTRSAEVKACGAINRKHTHTPAAQCMLISSEDFLLTTLTMSGILNKGNAIAATNAIFSIIAAVFLSY